MTSPQHALYTPGHLPQKLAMLVFGLILFGAGLTLVVPKVWLTVTGEHRTATVLAVVKEKTGLPDKVLRDNAAIAAAIERTDRSYRFWNVFTFRTTGGATAEARLPIPAVLKPIHRLSGEDGLPVTLPVVFDRHDPERVIFPTVFGTWVFPSLLTLIGLLTSAVAALLAVTARRPIEMPILHPHDDPSASSDDH